MSTPQDLVDEARRQATAICSAQVADSSSAAHQELLRVLDRIGDDPNRLYVLYRVLAGAVAAFAQSSAEELSHDPATQRSHALTMVRDVITNLELGIR